MKNRSKVNVIDSKWLFKRKIGKYETTKFKAKLDTEEILEKFNINHGKPQNTPIVTKQVTNRINIRNDDNINSDDLDAMADASFKD